MAPRKVERQAEKAPPDPLKEALAAHPRERTAEQVSLITQAGIDIRMQSLRDDQEKLRQDQ